jgi:predicted nucleotidyltransferase
MQPLSVGQLYHRIAEWAATRPDIQALGLVGSHARGTARDDSDVDLVLIVDEPRRYLDEPSWVARFGDVERSAVENYGKLVSLRVWYADGPEVEYGITDRSWAALPLDPGTAPVIGDGMKVLWERGHILSRHLAEPGYDP